MLSSTGDLPGEAAKATPEASTSNKPHDQCFILGTPGAMFAAV
jgi:hypothetical protein